MNKIQIHAINSIDEYVKTMMGFDSGWAFRGHVAESWALQPTLERVIDPAPWCPEVIEACENYSLSEFQSKSHHLIAHDFIPKSKLGWLSLMQHHGVPTRLLDLTQSPFVALFFAFEQVSIRQKEDRAVWAINYRSIMDISRCRINNRCPDSPVEESDCTKDPDGVFDQHVDKPGCGLLWVSEPRLQNLRLLRQKGTFLLSGGIDQRISDLCNDDEYSTHVRKYVIPNSITDQVFRLMESMGMNNSQLFTNVDGLAKDVQRMMIYQVANRAASAKRSSK